MNPAVAQPALALRDIHLPGAPSLWPPAPGWWVLAAVLLALVVWGIPLLLRRHRIRQQRERLFAALTALQTALASERSPEQLSHIGELLRRLALMRYPRSEVASLSGGAWLRFLDDSGGEGRFSDGPGRVLADGPYRRQLPPDLDIDGLAALVRSWVEKNAGEIRISTPGRPRAESRKAQTEGTSLGSHPPASSGARTAVRGTEATT